MVSCFSRTLSVLSDHFGNLNLFWDVDGQSGQLFQVHRRILNLSMCFIKLLHVVFQAWADDEIFQLFLNRDKRVASTLEHLRLRDLFREKFSLLLLQLRVQLQANFKLCLLAAQLRG